MTDAEAIIPSKRWEAWREGIEDYTYLYILREEIARSREPARAAAARAVLDGALTGVLDNPDDVTLAGEHHARVLAAIAELRRADR